MEKGTTSATSETLGPEARLAKRRRAGHSPASSHLLPLVCCSELTSVGGGAVSSFLLFPPAVHLCPRPALSTLWTGRRACRGFRERRPAEVVLVTILHVYTVSKSLDCVSVLKVSPNEKRRLKGVSRTFGFAPHAMMT